MECWNLGIVEENTLGRDERLLVQGTQTRAPPRARIRVSPFYPPEAYSRRRAFQYSHIPTFQ